MSDASEFYDVIIIGSGGGGAPIANKLAKAGKRVLVLDKGPLLDVQTESSGSGFKRDELYADGPEKRITTKGVKNEGGSFYSSHVEPDINDEPHVYRDADGDRVTIEGYTAQVVGGGTQLYGGVSLRFTQRDLALGTANAKNLPTTLTGDPNNDVAKAARDWPVGYDKLEPYYCEAELSVGINGEMANQSPTLKPFSNKNTYQTPLPPNSISARANAGMTALGNGNLPYRTPLAVITQDHAPSGRKVPANPSAAKCSYVNRFGDPLGLKSNTWVSLLKPVSALENFTLLPNCIVTHLASEGSKVTGVHYLDPSGEERIASSKAVVVACSAIESVRLLLISEQHDQLGFGKAVRGENNLLGHYFLTHAFGGASAIMPERSDKTQSLDADWATDYASDPAFLAQHKLWAGGAIYNNTSDQALPISLGRTHGARDLDTLWDGFVYDTSLIGQGFVDFFDRNLGCGLSVSFMANQVPQYDNRIELHPTVTDKWGRPSAYIIKTWHEHDKYLMDTLAYECAKILVAGLGKDPTKDSDVKWAQDNQSLGWGGVYNSSNGLARIANHILGGARFGTDPKDSVLDPDCRVWNFDNLYVTDGAFMPTSGGANPTLTIQANSFRVADLLVSRV